MSSDQKANARMIPTYTEKIYKSFLPLTTSKGPLRTLAVGRDFFFLKNSLKANVLKPNHPFSMIITLGHKK